MKWCVKLLVDLDCFSKGESNGQHILSQWLEIFGPFLIVTITELAFSLSLFRCWHTKMPSFARAWRMCTQIRRKTGSNADDNDEMIINNKLCGFITFNLKYKYSNLNVSVRSENERDMNG